jgi:hypothetical protein
MTIKIENETHWRTSDVKRIVDAALTACGVDDEQDRDGFKFSVEWAPGPQASARARDVRNTTEVTILLPRRGPKDPHSNPMMALAIAALEADEGAVVLAGSESFRMANALATRIAMRMDISKERHDALHNASNSDMPPAWAPPETFVIQKFKDPKLDGAFRDFVAKKEKALTRADQDMKRAEAEAKQAMGRLKKAQSRKKAAERSLQAARERRS